MRRFVVLAMIGVTLVATCVELVVRAPGVAAAGSNRHASFKLHEHRVLQRGGIIRPRIGQCATRLPREPDLRFYSHSCSGWSP